MKLARDTWSARKGSFRPRPGRPSLGFMAFGYFNPPLFSASQLCAHSTTAHIRRVQYRSQEPFITTLGVITEPLRETRLAPQES